MKSIYAVFGQMTLAGSNYLVFLIFTTLISKEEFIAFSTAVGLNMFAYAIAEGGVSYVAPREINLKSTTRGNLTGAFIVLSLALYFVSLIFGFFLWNLFSKDDLNLLWVMAYASYFLSVIIIPSWVTCWTIDIKGASYIALARGLTILVIFIYPSWLSLFLTGVFFNLFVIWFLTWLNRSIVVISFPNKRGIFTGIRKLKEVFIPKTSSYAVYSLIPLVVAAIFGNYVSSLYVLGERIKSMYSTLFQPLIQIVYLSFFQKNNILKGKVLTFGVIILNFTVLFVLILLVKSGFVKSLGGQFVSLKNVMIYCYAAACSVFTAILLYFYVLPKGNYYILRRSTYVQLISFILMFFVMYYNNKILPEYVLLIGELIIFVAVFGQLLVSLTIEKRNFKQLI